MMLWPPRGFAYSGAGVTRHVFLVGAVAIKVPRVTYGWKMFLEGLLANMQEREFGRAGWPGICPVICSLPGGWLVVQRRALVMTEEEFAAFDAAAFVANPEYTIPAELKADSFGWLDGMPVAVDYG